MPCIRFRFLRLRSRLQSGQRSKSCLSNNSKTTEANLKKFHGKMEHNKRTRRTEELGSYALGQGQIVPKIVLLIHY